MPKFILKRNKKKVIFDKSKIVNAISRANNEISKADRIKVAEIKSIANEIALEVESSPDRKFTVEKIQDLVEIKLIEKGYAKLAQCYIRYRYKKELLRQSNTTDDSIRELLEGTNDYWNRENSNKNAKLVTTQRDYMAGITSVDIARRFIFPDDVMEAHDKGILHLHDLDYAAENTRTNCELINLNDMLQNGTVLNGITIRKPHKITTAMNIATQIILSVSSSTYGGATVTLTHLAPFVRESENRIRKKYENYGLEPIDVERLTAIDLKKEVNDAVQIFNYQVNSMSSQNGQSPFISIAMYMGETEEYKQELAMLIEEFLHQRIAGMENEHGVPITVAFPKLLFILDEESVNKNSKYYYLTELAAECSSKRLTPDYISAKVMKENKINKHGKGDAFPCMGKTNYSPCKIYMNLN